MVCLISWGCFDIDFKEDDSGVIIIKTESLIKSIIKKIRGGEKIENIAYAFHYSLVKTSVDIILKLAEKFGINIVALSGGVFHNRLLLSLFMQECSKKNLQVLLPREMPFNDGCIAHGQIVVAKEMIKAV